MRRLILAVLAACAPIPLVVALVHVGTHRHAQHRAFSAEARATVAAGRPFDITIVTGCSETREDAEGAGAAGCVVKPLLAPQIPEVIAAALLQFEHLHIVRP